MSSTKNLPRPCAFITLVVLATAVVGGCAPERADAPGRSAPSESHRRPIPAPPDFSGPTMGTSYHVRISAVGDESKREVLAAGIERSLGRVDRLMSTYRSDSEISRFNRHGAGDWFEVSPETVEVVVEALRIAQLTDGAFDPTVGPLVRLWNFGPDRGEPRVPDDDEIRAVLSNVGFRRVETRSSPPAIRKRNPELELDLSAIAKGYAVDQIAEFLRDEGVRDFMIEVGGEIRVSGTRSDGTAWRIGIEAPEPDGRRIESVLPLVDGAVATSGDYRNFFEQGGRRYSHTIDPRDGHPVRHGLASVTVLAPDCMTADALATALMVMGPEEGRRFAERQELAALFLSRGDQGWTRARTTAFSRATSGDKSR